MTSRVRAHAPAFVTLLLLSGCRSSVGPRGGPVDHGAPSEAGRVEALDAQDIDGRYFGRPIEREGHQYHLWMNGWGPGFERGALAWRGSSFTVDLSGTAGASGEPAAYPSVFCGDYSNVPGRTRCGLPRRIAELTRLDVAWRWSPNGNDGGFNAALDVWLGDGAQLESFLMIWLRDPPGPRPAGVATGVHATLAGQRWVLWAGAVDGHPIVSYVRAEGSDLTEVEVDVLEFLAHARREAERIGQTLPGTHVNAVAAGFEIWGTVAGLESIDFHVEARAE